MKTTLPLLAFTLAAAVAAPALAQGAAPSSTVELYGRVDLGLRYDSATDATTGAKIGTRMATATNNSVGLKGTELLGDGMSAYFNIEHRFNAANGVAGEPFWSEISVVGLKTPAGTLQLGRQDGPVFYGMSPDAFYGDYVGGRGERKAGADDKFNGGLLYFSPQAGGLQLILGTTGDKGAPIGGVQPKRPTAATLRYNRDKLMLSGVYANRFNDDTAYGVAASYDFGVAQLLFVTGRNDGKGLPGLSDGKRTTLDIGTIVPVSAQGSLRAKYNRDERVSATTRHIGLGYLHDLSKRSNLYVTGSQARTTGQDSTHAIDMGLVHRF